MGTKKQKKVQLKTLEERFKIYFLWQELQAKSIKAISGKESLESEVIRENHTIDEQLYKETESGLSDLESIFNSYSPLVIPQAAELDDSFLIRIAETLSFYIGETDKTFDWGCGEQKVQNRAELFAESMKAMQMAVSTSRQSWQTFYCRYYPCGHCLENPDNHILQGTIRKPSPNLFVNINRPYFHFIVYDLLIQMALDMELHVNIRDIYKITKTDIFKKANNGAAVFANYFNFDTRQDLSLQENDPTPEELKTFQKVAKWIESVIDESLLEFGSPKSKTLEEQRIVSRILPLGDANYVKYHSTAALLELQNILPDDIDAGRVDKDTYLKEQMEKVGLLISRDKIKAYADTTKFGAKHKQTIAFNPNKLIVDKRDEYTASEWGIFNQYDLLYRYLQVYGLLRPQES